MKILIVEDQPMISFLLEDVVDGMGHEVVGPASNGDEAVALVTKGGFDGALVDYNLDKGSTSLEAALLMVKAGIPFIFLSGLGQINEYPELANIRLITKPFVITDIETAISSFQS